MVEVVVVDNSASKRSRRWVRWWWFVLAVLLLLIIAVGAFIAWANTPAGVLMPEALAALESNDEVVVTQRGWLAFVPHDAPPTAGIILYPGGRVQAEAYAPLAHQIAEAGYLAAIVYAPLNLAIFNPGAANAVMENFSAVDTWIVGGHSLGGVAAALFAADNRAAVDGLVLLASFPANNALATSDMPVLSIYGTNDGLATVESILASAANLPATARFVALEGGNHAQFGYYGAQAGDGIASLSHAEQTTQTVNAIVALLDTVTQMK
jgi:Alpha/beta hydrolase family